MKKLNIIVIIMFAMLFCIGIVACPSPSDNDDYIFLGNFTQFANDTTPLAVDILKSINKKIDKTTDDYILEYESSAPLTYLYVETDEYLLNIAKNSGAEHLDQMYQAMLPQGTLKLEDFDYLNNKVDHQLYVCVEIQNLSEVLNSIYYYVLIFKNDSFANNYYDMKSKSTNVAVDNKEVFMPDFNGSEYTSEITPVNIKEIFEDVKKLIAKN